MLILRLGCSRSAMSFSPMSAIAGGNFYTILSPLGYGDATLYIVDMANAEVRTSMNEELEWVVAMYYNPEDE